MNESTPKLPQFLLLFRAPLDDEPEPSPEEMEGIFAEWFAWSERVGAEGKYHGGNPLEETGKVIRGETGETVTDGPFVESKEVLCGYFLISATDMDDALRIARGCPGLPSGMSVEVRPIMVP
jgi:hypothetical protein